MSNRKKPSKRLDIIWYAKPYEATWAFGPEDVPVWDFTRGIPGGVPATKVHIFASKDEADRAEVPRHELKFVRNDERHNEKMHEGILWRLTYPRFWKSSEPPESGYPRLVRANYTEPIILQWRHSVDVLNELVRLLRHEPKPPGKWVLQDIADLNATVGPVTTPEDNTLARWLTLAHMVRAHFEARQSLNLGGFDAMLEDVWGWAQNFQDRPYAKLGLLVEGPPSAIKQFLATKGMIESPYVHIGNNAVSMRERYPSTKEKEFLNFMQLFLRDSIQNVNIFGGMFSSDAPLEQWVTYRLAEVWEAGVDIVECRGCHQLLFSRRAGTGHHCKACQVLRRNRQVAAAKRSADPAD